MSKSANVLVLAGFGLNCDYETAYAFELAGAKAKRVHINDLLNRTEKLSDYNILAFTGGFSWGDDHGAGVLQAIRLESNIGEDIRQFILDGKLIIGICNGFQTMVNMGLLPGISDYHSRLVALIHNDCGNFRNDWVSLAVNSDSPCVFTKGLNRIELPVRHGEGKFYADSDVIEKLMKNDQVVLQYADYNGNPANNNFPLNPNGSLNDIAGICDSTGRIFGLMPHPEAFYHFTNHPQWTRYKEQCKRSDIACSKTNEFPSLGISLFKNAVSFVSS